VTAQHGMGSIKSNCFAFKMSFNWLLFMSLLYTIGVFSMSELNSMIEESLKMSKFNHPNVMRLIGVCIDDGGVSPYIVIDDPQQSAVLPQETQSRAHSHQQ